MTATRANIGKKIACLNFAEDVSNYQAKNACFLTFYLKIQWT